MLGVKKNKRKDANNEREKIEDTTQSDEGKNNRVNDDEPVKQPKYGPILTFPYQKVWSRSVLILCVLAVVWYNSKRGKEIFLAKQKEVLVDRAQRVECAPEYKTELDKFPGCVPERCGRVVNDKLVSSTETDVLLKIAAAGMNLGGSDGGASILDLHSGALSKGTGFINIYNHPRANKIFSNADFAIYKMTNAPAKTVHDEYWLPHVDKVTYQHFHYTSLLYLNDHGRDFEGGRLIFIDDNNVTTSIEPRKGRVTMFTSGAENLHAVERVTSGTRYALTVSFTCDPIAAISDPKLDTSKS
ncbi:2-oxoglutarate and iron-dependent oxygenase domain-containing protein 3-like isoform X2 [Venturia canescens]|uniref:2-oxoglutarate and iron-dependent oxygenase domain-containing protein 3-like isoform X2 n=1 Tax=Venturia canescens TaxID=32260 RepID=UPI001C9C2937|nr:2-oxoglutarate and iron-dependent oxygenase domain-containing protein 3-like isoform X2 [Venturia canescens]